MSEMLRIINPNIPLNQYVYNKWFLLEQSEIIFACLSNFYNGFIIFIIVYIMTSVSDVSNILKIFQPRISFTMTLWRMKMSITQLH
jgi:hypothetical protein